jgi:hypothetical protein
VANHEIGSSIIACESCLDGKLIVVVHVCHNTTVRIVYFLYDLIESLITTIVDANRSVLRIILEECDGSIHADLLAWIHGVRACCAKDRSEFSRSISIEIHIRACILELVVSV